MTTSPALKNPKKHMQVAAHSMEVSRRSGQEAQIPRSCLRITSMMGSLVLLATGLYVLFNPFTTYSS